MKILIVGAGPTGLTAAVELARRGIDFDIIERRTTASNLSRAVGILPHSLNILKPSGVTDILFQQGIKLQNLQATFNNKAQFNIDLRIVDTEHNYLLAIPQDQTEDIMREVLDKQSVSVEFGMKLIDVNQNNNKVIVNIEQVSKKNIIQREYDYILGADGTRSAVRESSNIAFDGYQLKKTWSIADVEVKNLPLGNKVILQIDQGNIGIIVPIGKKRCRLVNNQPDALTATPIKVEVTEIHRQADFNIDIRQAETYQNNRVFLAGDAAHCHSPVGGRGMNLGIADAVEFARCVAENDLAEYTNIRHPIGMNTIKESESVRKFVSSTKKSNYLLLRTIAFLAKYLPFIRKIIAKKMLAV